MSLGLLILTATAKPDIQWQHDGGTPAMWLMDGFNVAVGSAVGSNPGATWHVIPMNHDLV